MLGKNYVEQAAIPTLTWITVHEIAHTNRIVVTAVGEKTADVRNIPEYFLYGKITL